jgi:hypothetical protein
VQTLLRITILSSYQELKEIVLGETVIGEETKGKDKFVPSLDSQLFEGNKFKN